MKPRRHLSNKLSAIGAATLLSITLTGITCGSFAWFAYTSRAVIEEFNGVTIGLGELEMGFVSNVELPNASDYGLIKDDSDPSEVIYWIDGHKAEPITINYFLSLNGYATDTLYPVTTSKYSKGDDFKLLTAPNPSVDSTELAKKENTIKLPLVFRYADILEDEEYISDENIYLSKIKIDTPDLDSHIYEAVRIYSDNKNANCHLINPSSSADGATEVGGILDLNRDGFYDTDFDGFDYREHMYGQVKESIYKTSPESDDTIVYPDQRTTFNAGHKAGTYAFESFDPEVAEFEGVYDFKNKRESVTTTNSLTKNYAYLDLSIFVEGWDLHVIDAEYGMRFSMDIEFEVES